MGKRKDEQRFREHAERIEGREMKRSCGRQEDFSGARYSVYTIPVFSFMHLSLSLCLLDSFAAILVPIFRAVFRLIVLG